MCLHWVTLQQSFKLFFQTKLAFNTVFGNALKKAVSNLVVYRPWASTLPNSLDKWVANIYGVHAATKNVNGNQILMILVAANVLISTKEAFLKL